MNCFTQPLTLASIIMFCLYFDHRTCMSSPSSPYPGRPPFASSRQRTPSTPTGGRSSARWMPAVPSSQLPTRACLWPSFASRPLDLPSVQGSIFYVIILGLLQTLQTAPPRQRATGQKRRRRFRENPRPVAKAARIRRSPLAATYCKKVGPIKLRFFCPTSN